MDNSLSAFYRLVYFQPRPEDGERICVALLLHFSRDVELLFYPEFPRLRCLAPHIDPQLIKFYLDDMASRLKDAPLELDSHLRAHTPHLVTSQVRRVSWPLSDQSRMYLMKRFLGVEREPIKAELKTQQIDRVKEHLRELLYRSRVRNEDLKEDAKPEWILGRKISYIKKVAFAVRKPNAVMLIDGVDLSVLGPGAVLTRVTKVKHTFWQYGKIRQIELDAPELQRIGVVLDGAVKPGQEYKDSHDFAVHEFKQEADITIDTASSADIDKFEDLIVSR